MPPRRRSSPPVPAAEFARFIRVVRRLRRDCPWDRTQTHRSLRESLLEEAYEVIEALDRRDMVELRKELGDLALHVAMQATIAEQAGEFTLEEVFYGINEKLIARHPHVFGTTTVRGARQVLENWERLKMKEGRTSVLEGVPPAMPALQRARRVQQRASGVGFDWKKSGDVWKKVREELEELRRASRRGKPARREEEFGDLLFSLVNFSRFIGVNPEHALRGAVDRFTKRFHYIEKQLAGQGRSAHDASLEEMDVLWKKAKRKGRAPRADR